MRAEEIVRLCLRHDWNRDDEASLFVAPASWKRGLSPERRSAAWTAPASSPTPRFPLRHKSRMRCSVASRRESTVPRSMSHGFSDPTRAEPVHKNGRELDNHLGALVRYVDRLVLVTMAEVARPHHIHHRNDRLDPAVCL